MKNKRLIETLNKYDVRKMKAPIFVCTIGTERSMKENISSTIPARIDCSMY